MAACRQRIAAREAVLRAFSVMAEPAATAAGQAPPGAEGPLHGLPVGVKDVLDTADLPTAYGSPIWEGWRPRADAASVAAARAAGAVVIGKTVTTEFATRQPGPTTNPHDPAHTPGGSSSGSAAGVAAGFFPLGFATQTAGSVIRPAAYCGVVGYKPSFGLINRSGMKIMSDSLDTIGVMARSVADCALFAGAIAGVDLGDPDLRPDRAPRIGLCRSPAWNMALPETVALFETLPARLEHAGAHVEACELEAPWFTRLQEAQPIVMNAESGRAMAWERAWHLDRISAELRGRLDWGLGQSEAALAEAHHTIEKARLAFPLASAAVDVLVSPSAPGEAPEGLGWTGDPAFNLIWTSLHVPCITVPAGTGPAGLPLGVQIIARRGEDRAMLAWAQWVAAALAA